MAGVAEYILELPTLCQRPDVVRLQLDGCVQVGQRSRKVAHCSPGSGSKLSVARTLGVKDSQSSYALDVSAQSKEA